MSVSEHDRHQLFTWFEEHMGSERAATMMSLLPPVGWGDVATKGDLDQQIAATRHDIDVLRQDVRRLEARVDAVEASLRQEMRELLRTFGTWLFASQAAVIAVVSLLFVLH
jgi:hypothetical protein